jgi:hypothetical protein
LSTIRPKNNDKKLRWLVEPVEIHALEEMERYTILCLDEAQNVLA